MVLVGVISTETIQAVFSFAEMANSIAIGDDVAELTDWQIENETKASRRFGGQAQRRFTHMHAKLFHCEHADFITANIVFG